VALPELQSAIRILSAISGQCEISKRINDERRRFPPFEWNIGTGDSFGLTEPRIIYANRISANGSAFTRTMSSFVFASSGLPAAGNPIGLLVV
jgi:hypothetical protein